MVQKSSMTNNNCHALITLVYRRACSNPTKNGQFLVRELTLNDLELIPQLGKRSLQPSTETPQLLNCTTGQPILIWQFDFLLCFHLFEMILIYHKHAMLEQAKFKLCSYHSASLPSKLSCPPSDSSRHRSNEFKWEAGYKRTEWGSEAPVHTPKMSRKSVQSCSIRLITA